MDAFLKRILIQRALSLSLISFDELCIFYFCVNISHFYSLYHFQYLQLLLSAHYNRSCRDIIEKRREPKTTPCLCRMMRECRKMYNCIQYDPKVLKAHRH